MRHFEHIRGFLMDLDGVLYIGYKTIPGAIEAITAIKKRGLPCRFVTNTTTRSRATLHSQIKEMGLPIEENEIITAPRAALLHLKKSGSPKCFLCLNDDVKKDFSEIAETENNPDFVVVGDIFDRWNYVTLNKMFRMIIAGAEIIALHKGRYWHEPDGLYLDIGAFVAALEYATGKTALIIGKPNRTFFQSALDDLGLPASEVAMIGDDIDSDIGGAQALGITGILVKTGKYRYDLVAKSEFKADAVIETIVEVLSLI